MKKIYKTLIFCIALGFVACIELDETPLVEFAPENVYADEQSTATALWGAYSSLQDRALTNAVVSLGFGFTDEIVGENWFQGAPHSDYTATSSTAQIEDCWKASYDGINRANAFIQNSSPDFPEDNPGIWIGEAKVIRAIHYFRLVRLFGEVPLLTEPVTDLASAQPSRESVSEVYNQIVQDLEDAIAILPPANEVEQNPRMSRGSAQGILMQVYATMAGYPLNQTERWDDVVALFSQIENEGVHQLNPDYFSLFDDLDNDIYESTYREILAEVAFSDGAIVPEEGGTLGTAGIGIPPHSFQQFRSPNSFVDTYDPMDVRYVRNIWTNTAGTVFRADKYRHETGTPNLSNNINLPLVRYADLMLLNAEALNEINNGPTQEAIDMVNAIRYRARPTGSKTGTGNANSDDLVLTNEDYASFSGEIRAERARELCFEWIRWYDLKRWNLLVSTVKNIANIATDETKNNRASQNIDIRHLRFPIPQGDLDRNPNLTQNDGY